MNVRKKNKPKIIIFFAFWAITIFYVTLLNLVDFQSMAMDVFILIVWTYSL